ncbi:MAG: hypothetical protein RLZZ515_1284, partial [Cyanobacteriota bacterium]
MGGTEVSQQNRMIAPSLSSLADRVRDLM